MQGLQSVHPKKGAIALRGSFWLDALLCELLPRYRQIPFSRHFYPDGCLFSCKAGESICLLSILSF